MEYLLFVIILLLICFVWNQDRANRQEREALEKKIMSRDLTEYTIATSTDLGAKEEEPKETHVPLEEISIETAMKAEDNL